MKKIAFSLLFVAVALQTTAHNQATHNVYGFGAESCGEWTENLPQSTAAQKVAHLGDEAWVQGFVSGFGSAWDKPLRGTDAAGIAAFINTYCAAHPVDRINDAAEALIDELQRPK